jgi:endoglucanase
MITEFGASNGTECSSYVSDIINYMANNDEYIGWTAWAAGPLWGSYSPCCADSGTWGSLEPGIPASDGTPGMYEGVWVDDIQPLLPTTLQKTGISNLKGPGGVVGGSSSSSSKTSTSSVKSSTSSTKLMTTTSKTTSTSKTATSTSKTTTSTSKAETSTLLPYSEIKS